MFGGIVHWKHADTSYANAYYGIDFRKHPELYKIGKGEQGVLMAQPYKAVILRIGWRFKTPELAEVSSSNILRYFYRCIGRRDFVGADMARKFLMMGWTRARRYANHFSGRKYNEDETIRPQEQDALTSEKAQSAAIFRRRYLEAWENPVYQEMYRKHKRLYG